MIDVERSIAINRAPQEVFAFVSDTHNDPRWHTDVLEAKRRGSGPVAVGSKYDVMFKPMMGKSQGTLEVVGLEPPRRIEMDVVFGPMRPHVTYGFTPEGKGTKVSRRVQVQPAGMMRLMSFMMRRMIGKRTEMFLGNLKTELER